MNDIWFSAMIRFAVLIGKSGRVGHDRSVVLVRASDWPGAKRRALEVGRDMERTYVGGTGEEVRTCLEAIETLDLIGDRITDGREVYSESIELMDGDALAVDDSFKPEASEPTQSGV